MQKWIISCITMMLCVVANVRAQDTYADKVQKYILQYKDYAVAEQKRSGVPASITLGQGILETDAGCSELVTGANNHFGIKCKKEWTGETFSHTDDAPNECFRKYKCAADSYKDHSEYLKSGTRYSALFKLSPTDYASWAFGLKRCGYATSPTYAQRLINIIENFRLQEFTYQGLNEGDGIGNTTNPVAGAAVPVIPAVKKVPLPLPTHDSVFSFKKSARRNADTIIAIPPKTSDTVAKETDAVAEIAPAGFTDSAGEQKDTFVVKQNAHQPLTTPIAPEAAPQAVTKLNGLKVIYVHKGEMLLQYAVKYKIRYEKLLEMNDLRDAPTPQDMYIYLEHKNIKGTHPTHIVKQGETMRGISQDEGVQYKKLIAYNRMSAVEEPISGTVLQLQKFASMKPAVTTMATSTEVVTAPVPTSASTTTTAATSNDLVAIPKDQLATNTTTTDTNAYTIIDGKPMSTGTAGEPIGDAEPVKVIPDADKMAEVNTTPKQAVTETIAQTPPTPQAVVQTPDYQQQQTAPADQKLQDAKDDLDALKSKLDKLVYADDAATETTATQPAAPQPTTEQRAAQAKADDDAKYYTVKGGDTAYSIARSHNITIHQLLDWNDLNLSQIKAGQRLKIKP